MKILVVDDSKTIRFILIKILRELGYEDIQAAGDVESAMNCIRSQIPDLILSDCNMPGKSGIDFLKIVRADSDTNKIPFIMITTIHEKKVIIEALKAGLQFYLLKPVEKNVLAEKLASLALSHNIQPPRHGAGRWAPTSEKSPEKACAVGITNDPAEPEVKLPTVDGSAMSEECIERILEHFFLVFDGEMSMPEFLDWMDVEAQSQLPAVWKGKSGGDLLALLRLGAVNGISSLLRQPPQ
jgi:two-component system chemotaxis response regulator CheY